MEAALAFDNRLAAFQEFQEHVKRIWKNGASVPMHLATRPPEGSRALAAVACFSNPRSIGNFVLNPGLPRTLYLTEEVLALSPEALTKILIHEAVHIGIGGHGPRFMSVLRFHGGARTGSEAKGVPLRVQRKEGSRYKTIREYTHEQKSEARQWATEQVRATGIKHRITF